MSRSDERRENLAALVASVIIHLLLILGAAWFLLRANTGVVPPKPLDEEPIRLTILPPAPKPTPKPQFLATPLGRYKKQVSDAIGSRWYYHVNSQMGLLNIGTVDIRFQVLPNGKVKAPRVLSNSSNESFASVSLAAVIQAEIPPIPPELVGLLENGRLEIDYSFTILGNR